MRDYIAAHLANAKDLKHVGVKGMKWGVRRDRSTLRAAAAQRKASSSKPGDKPDEKAGSSAAPAKKPPGNIQDNVESSSARYARLAGQAKAGQAGAMTEADLKFFNARTDALAKINKMNEEQPSWLKDTVTKVVQQSAQRQMQAVADGLADKYIGDPIKNALKGAAGDAGASTAKSGVAAAVKTVAAAKDSADAPKKAPAEKAKIPGMTPEQSIQYFRDNPVTRKPMPKDYSPSGNHDLFKQLREAKVFDDPTPAAKTVSTPDPSKMRYDEAINYFKDNPSATPKAPDGYSPNAQKLFMTEIQRLRGE